jgi:hypothetical protein
MRHLLLGLTLCTATADRASERDALLSADRTLSDRTSRLGVMQGFLPALTDGAAYLHPGAPLLRGTNQIRAFLETRDSVLTWVPAFADVSVDGVLGYSYGWIRSAGNAGEVSRVLAEDRQHVAHRGIHEDDAGACVRYV